MTLSVQEAQAIIRAPKTTVRVMEWKIQTGNYNPNRFQFDSALQINSETREDLFLRLRYRGEYSQNKNGLSFVRNANIASGLFAANNRIFAYDYDYGRPHLNTVGTGMPYYRQSFTGLHKHIWTAEGYGYAEPFSLTDNRLETIITAFAQAANIAIKGGFVPAPQEQLDLFL